MVKKCWICEKKLHALNLVYFSKDLLLCSDCNDLLNQVIYAQNVKELETTYSELLQKCIDNDDVLKFLYEKKEKRLNYFLPEEKQKELHYEKIRKQQEQEQERIQKEQERIQKEKEDTIAFLKANDHNGYYEYKVIKIVDERTGSVNILELSKQLNDLGKKGWRLKCAYTNELGRNSSSFGIGGLSTGTNSTVDESILILERFLKFDEN